MSGLVKRIRSGSVGRRGRHQAWSPRRQSGQAAQAVYRPSVWHRDHHFALVGIIGATALTLLAGFLGPSAVTLKLGPRDSYLPPWYMPAGM